jgi:hypothetical protein
MRTVEIAARGIMRENASAAIEQRVRAGLALDGMTTPDAALPVGIGTHR